jgi:ribosome-associated heat shock protein Hsp15
MRIDKLLWYLRLAHTRPIARAMAEDAHIRLNGRRVEHPHVKVSVGDVLVVPIDAGVRVVEIVALPVRRGPAPEAQACYRVLDETRNIPIAAARTYHAAKEDLQP